MNICVQCSLESTYPIVLNCKHILCLRCADKLKQAEKDAQLQQKFNLTCPQCKQVTTTPNVYSLINQQNFQTKRVSQTISQQLQNQTSSPARQPQVQSTFKETYTQIQSKPEGTQSPVHLETQPQIKDNVIMKSDQLLNQSNKLTNAILMNEGIKKINELEPQPITKLSQKLDFDIQQKNLTQSGKLINQRQSQTLPTQDITQLTQKTQQFTETTQQQQQQQQQQQIQFQQQQQISPSQKYHELQAKPQIQAEIPQPTTQDMQTTYQYNYNLASKDGFKPASTTNEDNNVIYVTSNKIVTQKINLSQQFENQDKGQIASPQSPLNQKQAVSEALPVYISQQPQQSSLTQQQQQSMRLSQQQAQIAQSIQEAKKFLQSNFDTEAHSSYPLQVQQPEQQQAIMQLQAQSQSQQSLKTLSHIQPNEFEKLKEFCQESQAKSGMKCKVHNDFITLYCENDKSVLCVQCLFASEQHKGHSVGPIKMAVNHMRSDNEYFRSLIQEKVTKIDAALTKSVSNKQYLDKMYQQYNQTISQEFDQLYQTLKKKEQELKSQVTGLFNHGIECYNNLIGEYQAGMENCQELLKFQSSNEMEIEYSHRLLKQLAEQVNRIQTDIHAMTEQDLEVLSFQQQNNMVYMIENYAKFENLPELFDSQQTQNKKSKLSSEKKKNYNQQLQTEPSMFNSPIKKNVYYQKAVGQHSNKNEQNKGGNVANTSNFGGQGQQILVQQQQQSQVSTQYAQQQSVKGNSQQKNQSLQGSKKKQTEQWQNK